MDAILRLNRARNHQEFREALSYWNAPSINYVYADADGNIAYQTVGQHPNRPAAEGQTPYPGWERTGSEPPIIAYDRLPGSLNPEKGYIVSSNNAIVGDDYEYYLGKEVANGFRARRLSQIVESRSEPITFEDVAAAIMETYGPEAEETLAYYRGIDVAAAHRAWLERKESWKAKPQELTGRKLKKKEKKERKELELLEAAAGILFDWDFRMDTDSPGAAAYAFVWKELLVEVYSDEVPDYFWPAGTATLENGIHYLLEEPNDPLWDDRSTPEVIEDRETILQRTLVGGLLAASKELGDKPKKWEWGEVHQVDFRNATLGESGIGPIERIFNRGPYPIRGGNTSVHKTNWSLDESFETDTIPSQRAIYDAADPSRTWHLNAIGQSGHPFHRHYDDKIRPYLEGEFHPSRFTREEAEASARGRRLTLRPKPE
jgi:penicillin amidase